MKVNGVTLNDPMLACAPIKSPEGQAYLSDICAASNFAVVNRSVISHHIRNAFEATFNKSALEMDMHTVYDVSHNLAKEEEHVVDGVVKKLLIHRKGATRAFPPGHPDLPEEYRDIGQPVMIGGTMGTCSYVLVGTETSKISSFGSTAHGAVYLIKLI